MLKRRGVALALLASPFISHRVRAEDSIVRIPKQYGLGYLSMMVMEHEHLVERHAAKLGLSTLTTEWSVLGGPTPQIDALLAGQIGFIGPGSTTLATLWDKTAGTGRDIRALSALQSMPFVLMTRNPSVHTIADLTATDKIALPGVKITGHALTLQMAGWVADPDVVYTTVPMKVMDFAAFMHRVGRLKRQPDSWKDMFFPESQDTAGS